MIYVRLLPAAVSLILIGAHYYRAGFMPLVVIFLAGILLLFVRSPWAVGIIKVELVIGGIEWLRTLLNLATMRYSMGMPWVRLSLILGAVVLITFSSVFIFRMKSLRERYGT